MNSMTRKVHWLAILLLVVFSVAEANAQGGSSASLSGIVVDSAGGLIPGASVEVKNNATGVTEQLATNTAGAFSVPALAPGTYTVTVALTGFKTYVLNDVRIVSATAAQVKVTLEVGQLTDTVEVRGNTELVRTQATTVQSTMLAEQINKLPLASRSALAAVTFLPGVEQIGNYRNSTINGLPQNTINITLDGIGIGNNLQSNDGFYSFVFVRTDAVEEVTVTGATPDASSGAQGSVQIAFTTRSGTNQFNHSIYHYFRTPELNSNYYFNEIAGLPKNEVTVHQYGGRSGGPIKAGKAFYFFNFEHFHLPNEATRNRTILQPQAMTGLFRYDVAGEIRQVNVMELAARTGNLATADPTVSALLSQIRTAAESEGSIQTTTNLNTQAYTYQPPSTRNEYAPTTRVDVNLTDRHRLTGAYLWQRIKTSPDFLNSGEPAFPGFPNYTWQYSYRTTGSGSLRSTLSSNLVNEFKGGFQWSPVDFYSEKSADTFEQQGGRALTLGFGLSNATVGNNPTFRNTPSLNFENSLSWLRGKHSLRFGGVFTRVTNLNESWNLVPTITLGFNATNDPANGMFNTGNFPGASTANLNDARALYALLTGRVTQVGGTSRLDAGTGEYRYLGNLEQRLAQNEFGLFAQDSWNATRNLTLNYGVRWEVIMPFQALTDTYSTATLADLCGVSGVGSGPGGRQCNLFKPGTLAGAGVTPQYTLYDNGNPGMETEWGNFAPNVGAAWRPYVETGWLRRLLGDPEMATLRAGYSVSFNRERIDRFTGIYGNNPGGETAANRNANNGNLVGPGESWPVLLSESSRLGPPATCPEGVVSASCVPRAPTYPIIATTANSLSIFDPELQLARTRSWTVGFQRSLSRNSAIEIRYVGNRNDNAWITENWNERNIIENGFLEEFELAQANLRANIDAGRGATFRYFGQGTGTSPLPTYLAYFAGVNPALAGDVNRYVSVPAFANTAWTGHLGYFNPDPRDAANDLHGDATFRQNALNAGLPSNFFVMNPAIGNANILRSDGGSKYHSLQVEYRRRLSAGLLVNASYTFAHKIATQLVTIHEPRFYIEDDGVPHAIRMNWTYELPFGRGRRFASQMSKPLDILAGGWEFSGTGRFQIQNLRADGIRLVGMTKDELQKEFKVRITKSETGPSAGNTIVLMLPDDIILNTRRAFSVDPTSATGYGSLGVPEGRYIARASSEGCIALYPGDCGTPRQIVLNGPWFSRVDVRATKRVQLPKGMTADVSIEFLNLFDAINFNPVFNPGAGAGIFQVTSAFRDTGVDVNDPGGRIGQLVWRLTW